MKLSLTIQSGVDTLLSCNADAVATSLPWDTEAIDTSRACDAGLVVPSTSMNSVRSTVSNSPIYCCSTVCNSVSPCWCAYRAKASKHSDSTYSSQQLNTSSIHWRTRGNAKTKAIFASSSKILSPKHFIFFYVLMSDGIIKFWHFIAIINFFSVVDSCALCSINPINSLTWFSWFRPYLDILQKFQDIAYQFALPYKIKIIFSKVK